MLDFVVVGVPAGLVVVAIVEALKRLLGIKGDQAIPWALVVGVGVALVAQAAQVWPAIAPWWETIIAGLLLGLAACGLFDAGKATSKAITGPKQ